MPREERVGQNSRDPEYKNRRVEATRLIIDKTPDQLRFPFAFWDEKGDSGTHPEEYRITMPIRTVGEYLSRWGFTPQKPV